MVRIGEGSNTSNCNFLLSLLAAFTFRIKEAVQANSTLDTIHYCTCFLSCPFDESHELRVEYTSNMQKREPISSKEIGTYGRVGPSLYLMQMTSSETRSYPSTIRAVQAVLLGHFGSLFTTMHFIPSYNHATTQVLCMYGKLSECKATCSLLCILYAH